MALIPCRECNGQISTEATACPHCGAPRRSDTPGSPRRRWSWLVLVLALGGVVPVAVMSQSKPGPENRPAALDTYRAVRICHDTARDRLKTPASAQFPGLGKITVQTTTREFTGKLYGRTITTPTGSAIIESYVDSQNSFGALIRTGFSCLIDPTGGVLAFEFTK